MSRDSDEPVRLNRIYTRGGDAGETSLGDGSRVSKLEPRIRAYGVTDELNSTIGVALTADLPERVRGVLARVQNELFDVGADLCVPLAHDGKLRITQAAVAALERDCDELNDGLPELRSFVLPGGTAGAAAVHVARTVCRRAELTVIEAAQNVELNPVVATYLNRLSDLLFIAARVANAASSAGEPLWRPGGAP